MQGWLPIVIDWLSRNQPPDNLDPTAGCSTYGPIVCDRLILAINSISHGESIAKATDDRRPLCIRLVLPLAIVGFTTRASYYVIKTTKRESQPSIRHRYRCH